MKDTCVRCGKETEYEINSPVTLRLYYVEGSGQLCPLCFQELYGVAGALEVPFGTGLDQDKQPDTHDDYSK